MGPQDSSALECVVGLVGPVSPRIDQALDSLEKAEFSLKTLRFSNLSVMEGSLARAASDLETLRSALIIRETAGRNTAALRAGIEQLGYATHRVCTLYRKAKSFHEGLTLARQTEARGYDALGRIGGLRDGRLLPHRLETRG